MPLGTPTAGGGGASAVDPSADWTMWCVATFHFQLTLFLITASKVPALPPRWTLAAHDAVVRNRNAVSCIRL